MSEQMSEIEHKLIEFATKTAETIQTQAGQIQALSHVMLIALVSLSEAQPSFKNEFQERIRQIRGQLSDRPVDSFTREYLDELVRFIEDPYNYMVEEEHRPNWFKGVISGGRDNLAATDGTGNPDQDA